ncbi:MAG: undecaprenyl/decaprenyl-phosphate alpha-N-acetylglucosaminyl 1-phosphate transferase [bacterium]|nr:undecaprenyl/decaprenyl-phosphate alpha-N-acetylglucosaminyl 1-phosphate transferase [bacterium]
MLGALHFQARTFIQVGFTAFLLSALAMPVAIVLLRRIGVLDHVAENKIHKKPIPRGGGIVIFIAFAVAVLLPNYRDNPMKGILIGGFICLVVGAVDDFKGGIPAVLKFVTLILVTGILYYFDVQLNVFKWAPLDFLVGMLWIVGVTSAFNGIDNMDGLASGVASIAAGIYLVIAVGAYVAAETETSLSWFGLLAAGLIGANLGFLIYNFKPARIFMGDSGSFFLGFTLAAMGIQGEWTENRIVSCTIPVLILGVPIFDFAYIIIARILRGETRTIREVIEHCAPDHLSHRLVWIGFSQRKAVLFIYLIAASMGVTGVLLRNVDNVFDSGLALLQGFAIVAIVVILMATAARKHMQFVRDAAAELRSSIGGEPDEEGEDESSR